MREHADAVEGLRYRLEAVRFASAFMVRDRAAYGTMCAWIADSLDDRFERQDQLVDFIAENLRIAADQLRKTADSLEGRSGAPALGKVRRADFWVDGPVAETGPKLADQLQSLVDRIAEREWADPRLTGRADGAPTPAYDDVLADFEPLRDLMDRLVGKPEVVTAQAKAWNDMSAELHRIAAELETELDRDRPEWTGEAHAAYRALMDHNVNGIGGIGATSAALAAAVEGAGEVVLAAMDLVGERSAALAGQLVVWAAEGASVGPMNLVAAVTKWALMVATHLIALARSLTNLREILEG